MDEPQAKLGRRLVSGFAWVFALRVVVRFIGIVSTMVLARLLVPADFGLIALATLLVATVDLLTAFDFTTWLIRHPNPRASHYDTVWTLSILRGVAICLVLLIVAEPASSLFDESRLALILKVLGIGALVTGFSNVGVVDFQRELDFQRDFVLLGLARFGSFVVSLSAAWLLRSYWALIAGLLTRNLLTLVLSYLMHAYRPKLGLGSWREIYDYSKWLLAGNILGFLYVSADTLMVGKVMSSQGLGLYSVSREIANLAWSDFVAPIRRVLLPGYAKMDDSRERLRHGFLDGFAIIMLFGTPCAAGIALTADPLVRVVLGEQWIETIGIIQILALYAFSAVGMSNQSPVLMVLKRTRLLAGLYALGLLILVPGFYLSLTRYGLAGGALALGVTNTVMFVITFGVTLRLLDIPVMHALRQVWRIFAATAVMACVVFLIQEQPFVAALWPLSELLLEAAMGAAAFFVSLLLLWRLRGLEAGPERRVVDFVLRSRLVRRIRGPAAETQPSEPQDFRER